MKRISLFAIVAIAIMAVAYFTLNNQFTDALTDMDYGDSNVKFRYMEHKDLSPYAMFGDSSIVLLTDAERYGKQFIEIFNTDELSETHKIEFDQKAAKIRFYNKAGELLKEELLEPEMIAKFLSVDPRADKYDSWSPYNYVLGNPIRNIDPNGDTVRIIGTDGSPMNWMPNMEYTGSDVFVSETVKALNLLYQNRDAGTISLLKGKVTGNVFDFTYDAAKHVSIRNMWNADGTAYNPIAAFTSIDWTNPSGTEILFDAFSGVHIGELDPRMAAMAKNSHHVPGNLSPATLLGHELGHAWLSQYAPELKSRLRSLPVDAEHIDVIHGSNGVETRFGMAIDGAARVFRMPYNTANPPRPPYEAPLRYYDHIITTSGATSNVPILNRYNH